MRRRTIKIIIWVILVAGLAGIGGLYYVFNMPRRNLAQEKALFTISAQQLIQEFKGNENEATRKYLDKAISVKGEIKSIRELEHHGKIFSLADAMEGVSCQMDSAVVSKNETRLRSFQVGAEVTIKGRCSGMLMDIQLIDCVPE